jgi:hypothetical protein
MAWNVGLTIFAYYYINNLIYWLFGFKYWVMAMEMPRIIKETERKFDETQEVKRDKPFWNERKYNILNWIGIISNGVVMAWAGWKRGYLNWLIFSGTKIPR